MTVMVTSTSTNRHHSSPLLLMKPSLRFIRSFRLTLLSLAAGPLPSLLLTMDFDTENLFRSYETVLPPRPLGLDKMFNRALGWKSRGPSAPLRPPSPPPGIAHLALPAPLIGGDVSPLSALFEYPDLVPEVLSHLQRPGELAVAARVCEQWAGIARRRLYRDIWVRPWEDAPKRKVSPRAKEEGGGGNEICRQSRLTTGRECWHEADLANCSC